MTPLEWFAAMNLLCMFIKWLRNWLDREPHGYVHVCYQDDIKE